MYGHAHSLQNSLCRAARFKNFETTLGFSEFHWPSRFSSPFSVLFFAGQAGRARSNIVIWIKPAPTQMIDRTEKPRIPSKFEKRAAQYNEFGINSLQELISQGISEC